MNHLILSEETKKSFEKIINKCYEYPKFKQELIANPVEAIEKYSETKLDLKGFNLEVADQSNPSTIYLNIPVDENSEDIQLSEEQLETVAGGGSKIEITIGDITIVL